MSSSALAESPNQLLEDLSDQQTTMLMGMRASLKSTSALEGGRKKKLSGLEEDHIGAGVVEAWEREFSEVESEWKSLQAEIETKARAIQELERKVQERDAELISLRQRLPILPQLDNSLHSARQEVLHHEQELLVLRDGLAAAQRDLEEMGKGKEFAEAETKAVREALEEKVFNFTVQLAERSQELTTLRETNAELLASLETAQTDLEDALTREARQSESSQSLISAQRELEQAYDEAVAQLEVWKAEYGIESEGEGVSEREGESLIGEGNEQSRDVDDESKDTTEIHPAAAEDYDVIDLQTELNPPPAPAPKSFKNKLQRLVRPKKQPTSTPSRRAVKLFAVKELEDDLEDLRSVLFRLVDEFSASDPTSNPKQMQRLQGKIDETMQIIQLTGMKLRAVRSFAD